MSKLTHFGARNFLTIKQAVLEFDESNIINLVGYNDSGKSALTTALEVLLYDSYKTEQVKCIHHGTDFFEVFALFDDGVRIGKVKHLNGASIWSMTQNGETLYTNKRGDRVIALDGVPDAIKKYLGVIHEEETRQKINVRRNRDKLFLVNTTGSENYKMITNILKIGVLNQAVKMINEDRNKLMNRVSSIKSTMDMLKGEVSVINVTQVDAVDRLEVLANSLERTHNLEMLLQGVEEHVEVLRNTVVPKEIKLIDTGVLDALTELEEHYNNTNAVVQPNVKLIDTGVLDLCVNIEQSLDALEQPVQPSIKGIDTGVLDLCESIEQSLDALEQPVQPYVKTIDTAVLGILETMGQDLKILNQPVQPVVEKIDLGDYALLEDMSKHLVEMTKVVQPEVKLIKRDTVGQVQLLTELKDNYEQYTQAFKQQEESSAMFDAKVSELKAIAKTENLTICKNCGLLAV